MAVKQTLDGVRSVGWNRIVGAVPITVVAVWAIAWLLASNGLYYGAFGRIGNNPLFHLFVNNFVHKDWGHFAGNMRGWVPVGILLTLATNNRHVLLIVVVPELLTQVVLTPINGGGVGFSSSLYAARAALLVRATGITFQNTSEEVLQSAVGTVLILACTAVFMLVFLVDPSEAGSAVSHFFGFLFGGAIESMYVLSKYRSR